jgi:hypothetical protein
LIIFVILFGLLSTGALPSGPIGKYIILSMIVLPLLGIFFGVISNKGTLKWILVFINIIAFCSFLYILLLGFGMGEA